LYPIATRYGNVEVGYQILSAWDMECLPLRTLRFVVLVTFVELEPDGSNLCTKCDHRIWNSITYDVVTWTLKSFKGKYCRASIGLKTEFVCTLVYVCITAWVKHICLDEAVCRSLYDTLSHSLELSGRVEDSAYLLY
jgi:hypothetical protein